MLDANHTDELVDEATEEFARRWREGERPSVEDFAARYPRCADELRTVLPAVVLMEQLKPRLQDAVTEPPAADLEKPPSRLGEYRLIRQLGRGGMGVVYEAEQETLGRRVALKILPRYLFANEKTRSRFRREAHAAARLHHTNIVPVFGVGECDEYCFYVMQLIHGQGLDQILRLEKHSSADSNRTQVLKRSFAEPDTIVPAGDSTPMATGTTPGSQPLEQVNVSDSAPSPCEPLSPQRVAQFGLQVAEALAYAHRHGVLHRDIKPSNLLLDRRGTVWITDFGVAKLNEDGNLTASGEFVGTLRYMPPERFVGQSDARGDIYSLGVTLHELIARQPAFPDTTPQHLIQLVTQKGLGRLRKLNPQVPTDLETIVLKAAACDPVHRYPTAEQLAADLRRFLDDRPILARRAGALEQAWRWCRRNPALAAVTSAALALMIAVTVVSVVAYALTAAANAEADRANREMRSALTAEHTQREQAEQTSELALAALNRIYDRFAPVRLVASPSTRDDEGLELPAQLSLPPEAVTLLEDLLRPYQQIARSGGEYPRLQAQAAEANQRIGDICQRLGRHEEAAAAYRSAIDLYTHLLPDSSDSADRIKLARSLTELGKTLRCAQHFGQADQAYERAIHVLMEAPHELAERPECRFELARASLMLGQRDQVGMPGPPEEHGPPPPRRPGEEPSDQRPPFDQTKDRRPPRPGVHPAQRAAELLERLVSDFPTVPEYRHLLACCYRDIPPDHFNFSQPPEKCGNERAIELLRQLVKDYPKVPDYRFDLCESLGRPAPPPTPGPSSKPDGKPRPKRERLEEAVTLSGALAHEYPNVPEYTAAHVRYLDRLAITLFVAGSPREAEQPLRAAVELQSRLASQYPENALYSHLLGLVERSLGHVLCERGEWKEAQIRLLSATERLEVLHRKDPGQPGIRGLLALAYRDLADVYTGNGNTSQAGEVLRRAGELGTGRSPPDPFRAGRGRANDLKL